MSELLARDIDAYRTALQDGAVRRGYQGLQRWMRELKTLIASEHPELAPGAIHVGTMDVTFIPLLPQELKQRKLKVLLILLHESFRFELWLSGVNKAAQTRWWQSFRDNEFITYELVEDPSTEHYFVREALVSDPKFEQSEELRKTLMESTVRFSRNIEEFLGTID